MKLLIKNGNILCKNGKMKIVDIRVEAGKITEMGEHLTAFDETILDAGGNLVAPGFIDVMFIYVSRAENRKKQSKPVRSPRHEEDLRPSAPCLTQSRFPIRWNGCKNCRSELRKKLMCAFSLMPRLLSMKRGRN